MNTQISKILLIVLLSVILGASVNAAVGTFTFRTSGASDTVEAVDLVYPQKVPEAGSVSTSSIADGSVTNAKLAEPVSVANGGTGAITAAEGLAALGGASLNGSSTVDFAVATLNIKRGAMPILQYDNGDTTPSVAGTGFIDIRNTADVAPLVVTNFDDGVAGQILIVMITAPAGNTITITRANTYFSTNADFVVAAGTSAAITLVKVGTSWFELSRVQQYY